MKTVNTLSCFILTLGLTSCTGGSTFADTCIAEMKLERETCACMAKKASEDLSPAGMAYVIAIMQKDKAQIDTLQSQIEPSESMTVALFLPQAAAQCAPAHEVN